MKSVYITEEQKNNIRKFVISEDKWRALLSEENSSIKKKVKKIIRQFCSPYVSDYLDTPLAELPDMLVYQLNPGGNETAMFRAVKNNPTENRFIDFLKVNLYDQMGTKYDKGPWEYLPGAARILCEDLGFYSFSPDVMRGGDIIKFAKTVKLIHNHPDFFLDGEQLDSNLNGMNYEQFMDKFAERLRVYRQNIESECGNIAAPNFSEYRIVRVRDSVNPNGQVLPTDTGRQLLNDLDSYTDWCICGTMQDFEYPQYTAGGGAVYIMMKPNFRSIEKTPGQNCPLDDYGLSLICVIVGPDGLPDNITTRWNHEYGGENPEGMSTASELQKITGVDYFRTFKPRSERDLVAMHINESEDKPSAMDQVHNKVNAGIMDAVTGCGMMEENQGNLETWYRGYNSKYGSERTHLLWLASDISYARAYGNRVEEVVVDMDKLNLASIYDLDGICGYEVDYYDGIDEEDAAKAMAEGFGGYDFEVAENEGYSCLCIWDKSCIVSRRELSKEEFDSIEAIEGYDNPGYDDEMRPMAYYSGILNENSNDRKVNRYIKEKFGLTDFQDIRNKVMEVYEKIPYARINGGQYMLGVLRLLFEENLPREDYSVLNKILYKIAHSNYYEKEKAKVLDSNFSGQSFDELKKNLFVPDFDATEFSTSEKQIKVANGYTVTRIDSYDEMNAVCDGEWCISYDDSMWYDLVEDGTVYLVENEKLIDKYDREYEKNPEYWQDLGYMTDDEDEMMDKGYINDQYHWTYKPGDWKFPYDFYGMSRFVVIVYKDNFTCYSRWNMPNDFDGDYLTKQQIEKLLGVKFEDVFKPVKLGTYNGWEYDDFGRKVPFGSVQHEMAEGAEPEADEYRIGGEGGNNEYFHAVNESHIRKIVESVVKKLLSS